MIDWPLPDDDDPIRRGTYCVVFDRDAGNFNIISCVLTVLDPTIELFKIKEKTKSTLVHTVGQGQKHATLLTTPSPKPPVKSTSSPQVAVSPCQSNNPIKKLVIDRDRCCIVTDADPSMCMLSHIIPKAPVQVRSASS